MQRTHRKEGPRLSRWRCWKALGSKRVKILLIALAIVMSYFLGAWLRSLPLFSEQHVLTGDDPYIHLRYAETILREGSLPQVDKLRYYPQGSNPNYELPLVSWLIVIFSKVFAGLQPIDVAIWLPVFFAPLIVLPVFFIAKELTKSNVAGVIAAFLAASAPGFIIRSFEGFCDKEGFSTPLMFAGLALALASFNRAGEMAVSRGIKFKTSAALSLMLATLSGVLIGIAALGWKGFLFAYLVLAAYVLLLILFGGDAKDLSLLSVPYAVIIAISAAFAGFLTIRYGGLSFFTDVSLLVPAGLLVPLLALRWLERRYVVILMVVLAVVIAIIEWSYVARFIDWLFGVKGLVRQTVAESQTSSLRDIWNMVGLPFFCSLFALMPRDYRDPKLRNNYLFALALFVVSIALAFSEIRLLMFLSIASSILAGDALSRLVDRYWNKVSTLWMASKPKVKKGLKAQQKGWIRNLALSIALAVLVSASTFAIPTYSYEGGPVINHATLYRSLGMSGYEYWLNALAWLRNNTSQDSIVISWWDYGYLIQYYAQRSTVVDPGNIHEWRNVIVAKFFMSTNETYALELLNQSLDLGEKEVYVLVSLEEIPKSSAITIIAGLKTPPFVLSEQGWMITNADALLVKLILGIESIQSSIKPSLERFEKVYANPYIAIYKVKW